MRPEQLENMWHGLMAGTVISSAVIMACEGLYANAMLNALLAIAWLWFVFRPICLQACARGAK